MFDNNPLMESDAIKYTPHMILEKWGSHIEAVAQSFGAELPVDRQVLLASVLENTQRFFHRADRLYETTQPTDVGPFKKFAFELITALIPNLISQDIVSVQPMTNRIGEVRYIKYLYGSNKGSTAAGTEFSSAFQLGTTSVNYSSEVVDAEVLSTTLGTTYNGTFSYYPVRPGTASINVGNATATDDGNGNLTGTGVAAGSVINYLSGAYTLNLSAAATQDPTAAYQFQLDYAPATVPQIDMKIETLPIIARSRKLKALYAFDAAFDMERDYGFDINTAMVSQIGAEIKHEIDGEILFDLRNQAQAQNFAAQSLTFNSQSVPTGVSLKDYYEGFYNTFIVASNAIFAATKRASATFLVVGTGAANVVESLSNFRSASQLNPVGPYLTGYLNNQIPVYKNPYFNSSDYVVGYKGAGLFDAGYVYAPYMPVMTTSLVMLDDFVGRRGFATSYGKKMVNPNLYALGAIN
jgi:hypothetical protein